MGHVNPASTPSAAPGESTPRARRAGSAGSNGGAAGNIDTTEQILKPDVYMPEKPTPAHVQRWRKDYEPGKVCIHPGISEDTDHTRIARYGKVEPVGAKVCDIMNVAPKSELLERAQNAAQSAIPGMRPKTAREQLIDDVCPSLTFQQRLVGFGIFFTIGAVVTLTSMFSFSQLLTGNPVPFALKYSIGNVISLFSTAWPCRSTRS